MKCEWSYIGLFEAETCEENGSIYYQDRWWCKKHRPHTGSDMFLEISANDLFTPEEFETIMGKGLDELVGIYDMTPNILPTIETSYWTKFDKRDYWRDSGWPSTNIIPPTLEIEFAKIRDKFLTGLYEKLYEMVNKDEKGKARNESK